MIWNIVDRRKRHYRYLKINAVIEDVSHDNRCDDADQFEEENDRAPEYDARRGVLLHEAILWAEAEEGKVTLYLYDIGGGFR